MLAERFSQYAEGQYVRDAGGKWWKVYHVTRDAKGRLYLVLDGAAGHAALREPDVVASSDRRPTGFSQAAQGHYGPLVRLDNVRDASGKVRVGLWDRAATFGRKPKDGVESDFTVETFGQMLDNWLARGERLSLCYNHQSAYTEQNGEPAPALAYYDAAAIVQGGQVVRFEKLRVSQAAPPAPAALKAAVAVLATDENPDPSPDGLWWYRAEVTEPVGQMLLPTFRYLSPMFVTDGQNEFGQPQGYTIFDLAATNTAFQAGCIICFDRQGRPSVRMARSLEELKARYRELNRELADERLSDSDANALRRERDLVQDEIRRHPDARPSDMDAVEAPRMDATRNPYCPACGSHDIGYGDSKYLRCKACGREWAEAEIKYDLRSEARDSFAGDVITCPDCHKPGVKVVGISPRLEAHDRPSGGRCPSSGQYVTEFARSTMAALRPGDWFKCATCGAETKVDDKFEVQYHTNPKTGLTCDSVGSIVRDSAAQRRFAASRTACACGHAAQLHAESGAQPCAMAECACAGLTTMAHDDSGAELYCPGCGSFDINEKPYGSGKLVCAACKSKFNAQDAGRRMSRTLMAVAEGALKAGDRVRADAELNQPSWGRTRIPRGTGGTVLEVATEGGYSSYRIRWDSGVENWLWQRHLGDDISKMATGGGVTMARANGYVYRLDGSDWRGAPDDDWETVTATIEGTVVGRRRVDGTEVVVIEQGGRFYAVLPQNVTMARDANGGSLEVGARVKTDSGEVTKLSKSGGTTMAKKFDEEMAKRLGLDEGADADTVRKALGRRMDEARGLLAGEDDDKKLLDEARRLDEEAAAYETAFGAGGAGDEPHVGMRRLAAKMRRMAGVEEPEPAVASRLEDEPFAGKETPDEEAAEGEFVGRMKAEGLPDDEAKQMARMGRRFGLDLRRATRRTIFAAAAAGSVPAARVETLVNQKLAEALEMERRKQEQRDRVDRATRLFETAVAGGYPADMREEFVTFATSNLDAAQKVFATYIKQAGQLFDRITHAGGPAGTGRPSGGGVGTASTMIRQHGAIRVVKYACDFAEAAKKLARDKGIKYEAALDQVQRERPELYEQYLQQTG